MQCVSAMDGSSIPRSRIVPVQTAHQYLRCSTLGRRERSKSSAPRRCRPCRLPMDAQVSGSGALSRPLRAPANLGCPHTVRAGGGRPPGGGAPAQPSVSAGWGAVRREPSRPRLAGLGLRLGRGGGGGASLVAAPPPTSRLQVHRACKCTALYALLTLAALLLPPPLCCWCRRNLSQRVAGYSKRLTSEGDSLADEVGLPPPRPAVSRLLCCRPPPGCPATATAGRAQSSPARGPRAEPHLPPRPTT